MNLGRLADGKELDVGVVGLAVLAVDKVTKVDQEVDVAHYKPQHQSVSESEPTTKKAV